MSEYQNGQHHLFGAPVQDTHPTSEATLPQGTYSPQGIPPPSAAQSAGAEAASMAPGRPVDGGTPQGTMPDPVIDNDWVDVPKSAPSTTETVTLDDGRTSTPRPSVLPGASQSLTVEKLKLFNQQYEDSFQAMIKGSVKAKKDKASFATQEDPMDREPWAPVANHVDSAVYATGSWTDIPRPPRLDLGIDEDLS